MGFCFSDPFETVPVFDPQAARDHAAALAFPRFVESPGEADAALRIAAQFRSSGLHVTEEPFAFSACPWLVLRGALVLSALAALASIWFAGRHPVPAGLLAALPVLIGACATRITLGLLSGAVREHEESPGRKKTTRSLNLVARRPADAGRDGPLVILMAHYDSKGQDMSLVLRILLFAAFAVGGVGLLLRTLAGDLAAAWPDPPAAGFGLLSALSALALARMRVDNRSPGAVDNASGVGVLLGLAEAIGRDPAAFPRTEVLFVATGAEEVGLQGAFAFLKRHADELKNRRVFVLNFDGPGVAGNLYASARTGLRPRSPRLMRLVREAGRAEGLRVRSPALVLGAMADHFPFVGAGIEAVTLAAFGRDSLAIHTPRDTPDRLCAETMGQVGRVALRVIEGIEEETP